MAPSPMETEGGCSGSESASSRGSVSVGQKGRPKGKRGRGAAARDASQAKIVGWWRSGSAVVTWNSSVTISNFFQKSTPKYTCPWIGVGILKGFYFRYRVLDLLPFHFPILKRCLALWIHLVTAVNSSSWWSLKMRSQASLCRRNLSSSGIASLSCHSTLDPAFTSHDSGSLGLHRPTPVRNGTPLGSSRSPSSFPDFRSRTFAVFHIAYRRARLVCSSNIQRLSAG